MTEQHFQSQVVSALKGIEKVLKDNWGVRQEEPKILDTIDVPLSNERPPDKFILAHICVRSNKIALITYPRGLCSMCQPRDSIDLFIGENEFRQLEELLKKIP